MFFHKIKPSGCRFHLYLYNSFSYKGYRFFHQKLLFDIKQEAEVAVAVKCCPCVLCKYVFRLSRNMCDHLSVSNIHCRIRAPWSCRRNTRWCVEVNRNEEMKEKGLTFVVKKTVNVFKKWSVLFRNRILQLSLPLSPFARKSSIVSPVIKHPSFKENLWWNQSIISNSPRYSVTF